MSGHTAFRTRNNASFYYNFNPGTGIGDARLVNNPSVEKVAPFSSFTEDYITVNDKKYNARILVADTAFCRFWIIR